MEQSAEAEAVAASFDQQIAWCRSLGSPFTAAVLEVARDDLRPGGPVAALLGEWPGDPAADALPLRFAGALHALVLSGQAPDLAACYPPQAEAARLPALLPAVLAQHADFIMGFLRSPPQTNEVGRSAVLLGGFLRVAAMHGPRLRLLEIGASAGLNLMWDRYHYDFAGASWGDPASPVRLSPVWTGALPPLATPIEVEERAACDQAPVDLEDPVPRLRLKAFVWADQTDRLTRLDAAIAVVRAAAVTVERADAADWVAARLTCLPAGCTTVLYHSIMWQYMPEATRQSVARSIEAAGLRATTDAPFAWLRFEPARVGSRAELTLTTWPGASTEHLATAHAHGATIEWKG